MSPSAPRAELRDGEMIVAGEVDASSVIDLRQQGETLISGIKDGLVVDVSGLETAHSVVLSMMLCWERLARKQGIDLSFRGINGRLASLASLSNLSAQLTRAD
ncbi:STAS domain-containing protein [Marinobacter pelagius]|uniref:Phospholipid transport system transporter-binding protein n=1 Tax=Marinobacter pelagius TaxID=379482 RepID=A0A1I4UKT4_9GAMM|nr:STAS domain-containing protein [Marinobacter pelagius]SFM89576.1 phospholipid transport system transporter-binding protein [Marinobacter pelagius]